jgi:hypothetical protein
MAVIYWRSMKLPIASCPVHSSFSFAIILQYIIRRIYFAAINCSHSKHSEWWDRVCCSHNVGSTMLFIVWFLAAWAVISLKVMQFAEKRMQFQESVVEYVGCTDNIITGLNRFQCQRWCRGSGESNCLSSQPCCNHYLQGGVYFAQNQGQHIFSGNMLLSAIRLFQWIVYWTENICSSPQPIPGMPEN